MISTVLREAQTHIEKRSATKPVVWTIAGSDGCGGAGIQTDLKTFSSLGVHGCCAISALTAQSVGAVRLTEAVSEAMFVAQLEILAETMPPVAIKTGMLWSERYPKLVAQLVEKLNAFLVVDPVLVSTSGFDLAEPNMRDAIVEYLLPRANLISPNIIEAHALLNRKMRPIETTADGDVYIEELAKELLHLGAKSVLIKGGHRDGEFAQDFWTNGFEQLWLTNHHLGEEELHGTGCTLAAALTSFIALGYALPDSLVMAKAYLSRAIAQSYKADGSAVYRSAPLKSENMIRQENSFLDHGAHPEEEQHIPWITADALSGRKQLMFSSLDAKMGFYPIVDSYDALSNIIASGITFAQLRVKETTGVALDEEIESSVRLARQHNCRLFINDHWQSAIKKGAYGVHLGQEDLLTADLRVIEAADLRLGISTHCYEEVARALAINPSYIAIGPIFPTTTKIMKFAPQGLEALSRWRRTLSAPLVAIGGISLDNATDVLNAGADSIAVVGDIATAANPCERAAQWVRLFKKIGSDSTPERDQFLPVKDYDRHAV